MRSEGELQEKYEQLTVIINKKKWILVDWMERRQHPY